MNHEYCGFNIYIHDGAYGYSFVMSKGFSVWTNEYGFLSDSEESALKEAKKIIFRIQCERRQRSRQA